MRPIMRLFGVSQVAQEERDAEHNASDNLRLRLEQELARLQHLEESATQPVHHTLGDETGTQ